MLIYFVIMCLFLGQFFLTYIVYRLQKQTLIIAEYIYDNELPLEGLDPDDRQELAHMVADFKGLTRARDAQHGPKAQAQ